MQKRILAKASILAGFLVFSSQLQASDLERRQSELKALQSQITAQQNALRDTGKQREKLLQLLKKDEQAIADAARKVNQTENALSDAEKRLSELKLRAAQLDKLKESQQQTLAKQLTSAYLAGNHDYSKMLLNQQDPATIERMLAYYDFLNKARMQAIEQLKQTRQELSAVQQSEQQERNRLNKLVLDQKAQSKRLNQEQDQRQQTLKELQRTISSKASELEQLQIEEASLKRVVEQALAAMRDSPSMDGLAKSRGSLNWPTKGRIKNSFGSQRSGNVRWKGVMLSAPEGQSISAVAAGKVIYADWLRGFGMVLVVDHGKGFMSLYGHAQALLKDAGDTVKAGEAVALVGRSGGQTEPGLYFEIRHKGQAVDPANYCRR
ncbi:MULTISPECIES: murein hydrolase activator EnvC family protein [Shewanella]|uniref:Peptidoglycan DD-metalloendopeptidase family protein n=2 Tax=Unclassified Bacteria TaxID=49928 RepID=A0AAU6VTG5_UNCXX|nr:MULTISPECIES: peptidoglycan DD-metalloendopeptidase family protein [Shewanella]NJI85895.1 peptidoglycan DD-metalloendopeptidase family protein [Shewanella sp. Iso12]MBO2639427.1 peptidoglycan DD-metalloendopeptidase family protein [Shewanella algae]MCT8982660.1 peptidoglycan DD-metalloendopeptidase family protein [Shewanella algae]MDC8855116.1 peptidoglycan DD-metalloendopeptidase family protein [Shewanella algae]MDE0567572.1 peptidoglycan DD-metalloendopeptidase family protein [Shewanella 